MFRWYRDAAKCYAYLSDVSTSADDPEICQSTWETEFLSSKWFTRGWTLQELLAPSSVVFYSSQYRKLGDKKSLARVIHKTTGIPLLALGGHPLDTFSVAERMTWAAKRQTTRDEDGAYCLLGIFGIFMPLLYGEGKEHALKRLQREVDGLSSIGTMPIARYMSLTNILLIANTCFTVPFDRNPGFVGRQSILAGLEQKLFIGEQTTRIAIAGLGGIGKTQLALELAYRTRSKYKNCSIFWIPATDIASLHLAYQDIARQLRIPGRDEEKTDIKKLVQAYLSKDDSRPWLLVFDNADDIGMWIRSPGSALGSNAEDCGFKEYLPRSKQGCIVFTTRNKKTAVKLVGPNFIEVPEMDEDGAIQLLQKSLAEPIPLLDQREAKALLTELTYLPLAIVQAAAYMNENSVGSADYLSLFDEQEQDVIELLSEEFEDDWRYKSVKNPVATTWLISFEQIRARDPLAAEYLSFMACIDRKDIPQSLLPVGRSRKVEMEAVGTLRSYSFLIKRGQAAVFDLHRLVHLATRSWLQNEGALSQWGQTAIDRLDDVFPDDDHQNRAQWRALLPHAAYALREASVAQDNSRRLNLTEKYARSLSSDGRYREAEKPFEELLETGKRLLGQDDTADLGMSRRMEGLASIYRHLGRWDAAEELLVQVIETRKKKLGADHLDTLTSINNLASTFWEQGRWDAAEELLVQVIETSKKKLGADHLYTLTSMNNLASTFWEQGRWDAAEELQVQVIETRKKKLGSDHPDTVTSMNNLASIFWSQGRWDAAEELLVQVMEAFEKKLGADHPDTLTSMTNLACTWKSQGRDEAAIELMIECVRRCTDKLGADHPFTSSSKKALNRWKLKNLGINSAV
jgi:tetratricopeptide (TPR) repeat protein